MCQLTEDTKDDDNETFGLVLSDVSGAFFSPGGEDTLTAIGTITDDDSPFPTLSVGAGTGGETTGEVVFHCQLE